jgi:hypothetical protein
LQPGTGNYKPPLQQVLPCSAAFSLPVDCQACAPVIIVTLRIK